MDCVVCGGVLGSLRPVYGPAKNCCSSECARTLLLCSNLDTLHGDLQRELQALENLAEIVFRRP